MASDIQILDSQSANQIAAGEVVERPASVVKELVENALDAGAKHIDITIEENGVPLIKVRDDGKWMSAEDMPLAVLRHATSKITRIQDLDQLQTLGFRGEALASIASVSSLEIMSRPSAEAAGLSFAVTGGEQGELQEVGCPPGTSVTIRNLFFNTPARLKFLKSKATEFGLISDMIGRIALAHPEISFSLAHPTQVVLQTSGRGDLRETMGAVFGPSIARQLIPIKVQNENWTLEGLISPPDLVRSSKQAQNFMINGRVVRSAFLSNTLEAGYRTLIPVKLHPIVALHLHGSPADYDVNVHPTKMDVKFKDEPSLASFIAEAVYQTLLKSRPLPSFRGTFPSQAKPMSSEREYKSLNTTGTTIRSIQPEAGNTANAIFGFGRANNGQTSSLPPDFETQNNIAPTEELTQRVQAPQGIQETQDTQEIKDTQEVERIAAGEPGTQENSFSADSADLSVKESPAADQFTAAAVQPDLFAQAGDEFDSAEPDNLLSRFWPVGQVFNTYILATDGEVLLMIDQHAAHERINYERILAEFQARKQASQTLLIPIPLELTLQEEQVLLEHLWILREMGFILEQFGSQTYLLRGVPVQSGNFPPDQLLRQFIEEVLQKSSSPSFDELIRGWIYLLACKESIKAKDSLNILEMGQLISRLGKTENPYTCPHGRPTTIEITKTELEKRFYRIS